MRWKLRRSIVLSQETLNQHQEFISHAHLGRALSYCGNWGDAYKELTIAFEYSEKKEQI